jgi:hypothetical protein
MWARRVSRDDPADAPTLMCRCRTNVGSRCWFPSEQRRRRSPMILNAYIDESEDDAAFVMAGYVASAEEWAKFSDDWDAALTAAPAVPFLKTSEVMKSPPRGPFWGLSSEERDEKLRLLYSVIDKYVFFEVSSVVLMEPLKRIFSDFPKQASNPYYYGLVSLIDGVIRRQIECGMKERIDFIFDERPMEQSKLLSVWDAAVHDSPEYVKSMIGSTPDFKKDTGPDGLRPLQAADLEVWWLRRRWLEKLRGLPRLEYPWDPAAIPAVMSFSGEAELKAMHEKMEKAANDLAILDPSGEYF